LEKCPGPIFQILAKKFGFEDAHPLGPAWAWLGPGLGSPWAQLGPGLGPSGGPRLGPTYSSRKFRKLRVPRRANRAWQATLNECHMPHAQPRIITLIC